MLKILGNNLSCFARQLRRNQTEAEKKIWRNLKSKQIKGLKFRRQQLIGPYIVDFVCFENKLIIELDGSQHIEDKENDFTRDNWLKSQGFTVMRFWNNEVMNNIEGVLTVILNFSYNHPPLTPPAGHGCPNAAVPWMARSGHRGRGIKKIACFEVL